MISPKSLSKSLVMVFVIVLLVAGIYTTMRLFSSRNKAAVESSFDSGVVCGAIAHAHLTKNVTQLTNMSEVISLARELRNEQPVVKE